MNRVRFTGDRSSVSTSERQRAFKCKHSVTQALLACFVRFFLDDTFATLGRGHSRTTVHSTPNRGAGNSEVKKRRLADPPLLHVDPVRRKLQRACTC